MGVGRAGAGSHLLRLLSRPPRYTGPGTCYGGRDSHSAFEYLISGTQTLIIEPMAEHLTVTADPGAVQAGEVVTFTARVEGEPRAVSLWLWVPADGVEEARTVACRHTNAVCSVPVYEDGTMYADAFVNGFWERAGATVTAAEVTESLVLELSPTQAEVQPVVDRTFDAVAQHWSDPATGPRLSDVVELHVRAYWEPSGRPAAGALVNFTIEPVEGSGGHPHSGRPSGSFFRIDDRPTAADQKKGVKRPSLNLALSQDGTASVVCRASGVSGLEIVNAMVTAEGQGGKAASLVTIKYSDLVQVPLSI